MRQSNASDVGPYDELPKSLTDLLAPPPKGAWLLPGELEAMEKVAAWVGDTTPESDT